MARVWLQCALRAFEDAVDRDPDFALAYVRLAHCYALLSVFGVEGPDQALPKARASVMRALELAPDLAEAHAQFAHVEALFSFDWVASEWSFHRELPLAPLYTYAGSAPGPMIHAYYGDAYILQGLSLKLEQGQILGLLGRNGVGKTTLVNSIVGFNPPRRGKIVFAGRDITSTPPHDVVKRGISQSPEGRKLFPRMSVVENLEMGAFQRTDRAETKDDMDRVFTLFPRLAERKAQKAGTMSGGEQQMLAIGRALMASPKLLLLDEPGMGLAPILVERIYETIEEINRQGTTILLVEQNANFALEVAARGYVLETGTVALTDRSDALRRNPEVQRAYLGT